MALKPELPEASDIVDLLDVEEVRAMIRASEHGSVDLDTWTLHRSQSMLPVPPQDALSFTAGANDFSASFWHDVVDRSAAITLLVDESGTIIFESAQLSRFTGMPRNARVGEALLAVLGVPNVGTINEAIAQMAQGALARATFDFTLDNAEGEQRTFMAVAVNALHESHVGAIVLTAHDISDRKTLETKLRHNANHDSLTGLSNRRSALRRLNAWIRDVKQSRATPAVLLLDLDGFKSVNDAYGHATGDAVLVEIAGRLRQIDPENVGVARLGGDEIILYARFVNAEVDAPSIAKRALDEIRRPVLADGHWIHISASVGIAAYPQSGQSADELIRGADVALHRAKAAGRGTLRWFDPEAAARQREAVTLRSELTNALPSNEFRVYFQPIVAVNTGLVHSHETLLRWQHKTRGLLDASQFIETVESAGLTDALTQWVLHESFAQARASLVISTRPIAINISPRSLQRADFAERLLTSLRAAAIDPTQIEIEITEEDFVRAADEVPANITALHSVGMRIIIDDFGRGFSNFGYLARFPVYAIKIDRSYVSEIGQSERTETLIGALVRLADELGIKAIGEGVETHEQSDFLVHHGCILQQGFLHGRPRPAFIPGS